MLNKNTKKGLVLIAATLAGNFVGKALKTNTTTTALAGLAVGLIASEKLIK